MSKTPCKIKLTLIVVMRMRKWMTIMMVKKRKKKWQIKEVNKVE